MVLRGEESGRQKKELAVYRRDLNPSKAAGCGKTHSFRHNNINITYYLELSFELYYFFT